MHYSTDSSDSSSSQQESSAFITDVRGLDSPGLQIYSLYAKVMDQVQKFDEHMNQVLLRHESDFLNAFKLQMHSLYSQIRDMKRRQDEIRVVPPVDKDLVKVQHSLKWFQDEAVRLGKQAEFYKREVDKWKAKARGFEDDCGFLENQVRRMKKKLKGVEHKVVKEDKAVGPDMQFLQPGFGYEPKSQFGARLMEVVKRCSDQQVLYQEIEKLMMEQNAKFTQSVKHLKSVIKIDQRRIRNLNAHNTTVVAEKTDLESIFLQCVEETKKELQKRQNQSLLSQRFNRKSSSTMRSNRQGLTATDKRSIMERLLGNEKVLLILYEQMFPHKASLYPVDFKEPNDSEIMPDLEDLMSQVQSISTTTRNSRVATVSPSVKFTNKARRLYNVIKA